MLKYLLIGKKGTTIVVALLTFLCTYSSHSQSKETVVTYNLDTREFESNPPFDEVIKIKFKSLKPLTGVRVEYRIDSTIVSYNNKKKYYFQKETVMSKEDMNMSNNSYTLGGIGPLHPNTPYIFEFFIYEKANLGDATIKALKEDLKKIINVLYVESEVLPEPEEIEDKFTATLQKYTDGLYYKNGHRVTVSDLFLSNLGDYKQDIATAKDKIDLATNNYKNLAKQIAIPNFGNSFCQYLENLDTKKITNANIIDEPVNILLKDLNSVTLNQMIAFYKLNCNRNWVYTEAIIKGKAKFTDNNLSILTLENNQVYQNAESLRLLETSLDLMNQLKQKVNSPYFDRAIDKKRLATMIKEADTITINRKKITELNANVPDILVNKYSRTAFRTDYYAVTDVESKATPYINLDLGLLYATDLQDIFALQTVNFHLKPVNRNAPFERLKGWDKFWKQSCLQLGLAQRLGPSDKTYHTFLMGDFGTPYAGLGFRFSRIVRVSAGVILYQQDNNNPVITDKITKGSFSFTITINSALSSALGYVGGIFTGVKQ